MSLHGNSHAPTMAGRQDQLAKMSAEGRFRADKYQVCMFSCCTSRELVDDIRGKAAGKDRGNLDIVGTTKPTLLDTYAGVTIAFIKGILNQSSIESAVRAMSVRGTEGPAHFHDGLEDNPGAAQ